jgi:hypothetical protein
MIQTGYQFAICETDEGFPKDISNRHKQTETRAASAD